MPVGDYWPDVDHWGLTMGIDRAEPVRCEGDLLDIARWIARGRCELIYLASPGVRAEAARILREAVKRPTLDGAHELLGEKAMARAGDYVALRHRIREMLNELEADDE